MQLILGEVDPESRYSKKRAFYIFVGVNSLVVVAEAVMVYSQTILLQWTCALINAILYTYLLILYCVVMRFLMQKLKSVESDGNSLSEEKKKIKNQFLIFMMAYLTSALFYIFEW